jgi:hypothetical protein
MGSYELKNTITHVLSVTDDEMKIMEHGHILQVRLGIGDFIEIRRTNGE